VPVPEAFADDLPVVQAMSRTAEQRSWLAELPGLVADLEQRWAVTSSAPYRSGSSSWAAPASRVDGTAAVLKVAWPHREATGESAGLRLWAGDGAPLLYEADPRRYALLMERCEPGLAVSGLPPEPALAAAGDVLVRLWLAPADKCHLELLADVCDEWAALVQQRFAQLRPPFDPGLVRAGARLLHTLPATASRSVVLHGDANPGNILSSARLPWLAIDPKPMIGDPGYDPAPLLVQLADPFAGPDPVAVLLNRAALMAEVVTEPADRLLAWAFARTVESALWHTAEGEPQAAGGAMAEAAVLALAAGV